MLAGVSRKLNNLLTDPTLRRWTVARCLRQVPGEPNFTPHRPPYLKDLLPLGPETPRPPSPFRELAAGRPATPIALPLPGLTLRLGPGDEQDIFRRRFEDTETLLALHRFAWVPLLGPETDPAWVQSLWEAWRERHRSPDGGWPWHPYTAAERVANLLGFGRRQGLPAPLDDTLDLLAAHGPAIAGRLEYFGDHHTSNHLANNGRGLYLLGLSLGLERCAALGARVLVEEAARIFLSSGILREGSSHYHLLLLRNYAETWLAARAHARPEAPVLEEIVRRALGAVPPLVLPGGMPLIGDISPDCPPAFLAGLIGGEGGWTASLDDDSRESVRRMQQAAGARAPSTLAADGWLRGSFGPWTGLWHTAPGGWSTMPGHGHADIGSFELHFGREPVFVDPGRGAYGETGEAAFYRSASAHNTLLVDGEDPYPPNRPYYSDDFRRQVGGPEPEVCRDDGAVILKHSGYRRMRGVGAVSRRWRFTSKSMTIEDQVEGSASKAVSRRLLTPHAVEQAGDGLLIKTPTAAFRMSATGGDVSTAPAKRWTAYGESEPATMIRIDAQAALPWHGTMTVEVL